MMELGEVVVWSIKVVMEVGISERLVGEEVVKDLGIVFKAVDLCEEGDQWEVEEWLGVIMEWEVELLVEGLMAKALQVPGWVVQLVE